MKKLNKITFNHADKEIIITKAFETEANAVGSNAYNELVRIRKDFPDYTIKRKEITKRENKKSFKGLTIEEMKRFLATVGEKDLEGLANPDKFLFKYKNKLDNPIMLGYLIHLLTDRFYNEYFFKHFYIYDENDNGNGMYLKGKKKLLDEKTRKDLKYYMKDLKEFTKRGGETLIAKKGVSAPSYLHKSISRYRRRLRSQLKYQEYFINTRASFFGKYENVTREQALDEEFLNYKARQSLLNKELLGASVEDLINYQTKLMSNTKNKDNKNFQNAFIEILVDTSYVYDVPHEDVHNIVKKIKSLTPREFYDLFKQDRAFQGLIYYYQLTNVLGVDLAYENNKQNATEYLDHFYQMGEIIEDFKKRNIRNEYEEYERQAKKIVSEKYPFLKGKDYSAMVHNLKISMIKENNKK